MVWRPARAKSAAFRGPTPFRYCSAVWSTSPGGDMPRGRLLNDDRLAPEGLDLPDVRGEREWRLQIDTLRVLGRARVVAHNLLQQRFGDGDAAHDRLLEVKLGHAVRRVERADGFDRNPPREHREHAEASGACLGFFYFVEIDQRAPAQPPGFLDRHDRFKHTGGNFTAGVEFEKRVQLALSHRRTQGLLLRAEPVGGNQRDLA